MDLEPDSDKQDRHDEFVALFVRHEPAIRSFVLTLLPDLAAAEDVVQQASMTMWRRFDQYQPGTSFRNWAFQVAKFTAMNHMTKLRRDRHVFSERLLDMLAEQATQRSEHLDAQRRALAFASSGWVTMIARRWPAVTRNRPRLRVLPRRSVRRRTPSTND